MKLDTIAYIHIISIVHMFLQREMKHVEARCLFSSEKDKDTKTPFTTGHKEVYGECGVNLEKYNTSKTPNHVDNGLVCLWSLYLDNI